MRSALRPKVIICDEPVSALDVSVRAQVINLLQDLQQQTGVSFLFISHDLSVVEHISDRLIVMYLGRIVAKRQREEIWRQPAHPPTLALAGSGAGRRSTIGARPGQAGLAGANCRARSIHRKAAASMSAARWRAKRCGRERPVLREGVRQPHGGLPLRLA